ncbi:MAG: gliding motility-associated C-terminal domain-containing protein [Vicingaceae bacterium]|nr:gliding motility-associated C-terminal domain-containing protein [Flavobacteriales bacterium]WKZ74280.1 MAG: gliding motility-associated C-terminal domain-containing protein [Vicingaceae bacterium]
MNNSFEEYNNACDTYLSAGIYYEYCNNWYSPDNKTPDYFNECNIINWGAGVPQNGIGHEVAKSGIAYAGGYLYFSFGIDREFVQGSLKNVLQKDSIYCISFFISHGDSSNYYINAKYFGILFLNYKSDYSITPYLTDSLAFIQQKVSFVQEDYYLENDSGWVELKMNYKAKGDEKYFIIGNFALQNEVIAVFKQNTQTNSFKNYAYYYLDEVSIYRCNDTLPPPIPKDTAYLNLPTAFSPNADGENDVFRVLGTKYMQSIELRVYNRWGQQVFYSNEKETGWDGIFKGQPAPTGVYAYTLVATLPNGEVITKKGNVTLKR